MWEDKGQVVPASLLTATRESRFSLWKSNPLPLLEGTRKEFLTQVYRTDNSPRTTLKFSPSGSDTIKHLYAAHSYTVINSVHLSKFLHSNHSSSPHLFCLASPEAGNANTKELENRQASPIATWAGHEKHPLPNGAIQQISKVSSKLDIKPPNQSCWYWHSIRAQETPLPLRPGSQDGPHVPRCKETATPYSAHR